MTRRMPELRKTLSTADLYADPFPPPQEPSLYRSHTTAHRPRVPAADDANSHPRSRHDFALADLEEAVDECLGSQQRRRLQQQQRIQQLQRLLQEQYVQEQQYAPPRPPKVREDPPSLNPYHFMPAPAAGSHHTRPSPRDPRSGLRNAGPEAYTQPFLDYMTKYPTIFHAVDAVAKELEENGYKKLSERDAWPLRRGGKYYVERNGSALIAFAIGEHYEAGNGAAVIAGHIDALSAKLKPVSKVPNKAGFVQLGVAPYAGALNSTWWDRDLGIGGRVLVKENGKVVSKLVKLGWPIARIPTLAPHFGAKAAGPFNMETEMVPIIGLDNSDLSGHGVAAEAKEGEQKPVLLGGEGSFTATQPQRLVKAIAKELSIDDYSTIINWELELYDIAPAVTGGLDHEFIFAGRIDDKLCSWAAIQALLNTSPSSSSSSSSSGSSSSSSGSSSSSSTIKMVALFDDEEVGSLLRQGARGNFLPSIITRIVDTFASSHAPSLLSRTYANSFLVSSDVTHAVNPNFLGQYLENHAPRLNVGPAMTFDSNAHMTTDSVAASVFTACVEGNKAGAKLQLFQIRNDSRSGGTVGPMLSAHTGMRAIDCGIPQLSMHSIRATTGSLDPGLGVSVFQAFLERFEEVDGMFR